MTGSPCVICPIDICGPAVVAFCIGDIIDILKGGAKSEGPLSLPGAAEKKAGVPKSDGLGAVVALIGYDLKSIWNGEFVSMLNGIGLCWGCVGV